MNRRDALTQTVRGAALLAAAPYLNIGRYRIFPWSSAEYSGRCVKLVRESIVIDMLGLLSLGPNGEKWMKNPDSFTDADLQRFRDSGITTFHTASGTGGPDVYEQTFWFLSGFMLLTFFVFMALLVLILLYVYQARLIEAVTD